MFAILRNRALALVALCLIPCAGFCATTCSMAAGKLVFGVYDVFSTVSLDSTVTLVVTCRRDGGPANSTISIAIGPSATGGSIANRRMQTSGGADILSYNLFRDAARTIVWGNTAGADTFVQTITVPNKGSTQITATIFARIPAVQDVRIGTYSDIVMATVAP
jgi:spore coat protein U domain-containing protein, fimbrial subunit CupE1/2/3/6